ncbi:MAG: helical backbone metal receptor [Rhodospirillales bacterium]
MTTSVPSIPASAAPRLTDWTGRRHDPAPDARILSLVPSLTETLFALGLGDNIVGRTAFCIHPADKIKKVKSVGGTKQVNWQKVTAAAPTHVVLNVDENPKEMAEEMTARGIVPVVTHPIEPADNAPLIRLLGGVFGRDEAADDLAKNFEDSLAAIAVARPVTETRVLYLIWKTPWMTVGPDTYIARTLDLISWRTWAPLAAARYPEIDMTDAVLDNVDRVLFSTEPFPFTEDHLTAFRTDHPDHAAKAQLVDGEMLSWYGVRAAAGLSYLKDLADSMSASRP